MTTRKVEKNQDRFVRYGGGYAVGFEILRDGQDALPFTATGF